MKSPRPRIEAWGTHPSFAIATEVMNKTLLIIDDALIIREMIKDIATEDGWTVVGEASDGREGVELHDRLNPDAITLDLVMPEFDGLHALKHIMAGDPAARVLVVSALDQTEILKQALQLGAADFIVKPFARQRLGDALRKLVDNRRSPEMLALNP